LFCSLAALPPKPRLRSTEIFGCASKLFGQGLPEKHKISICGVAEPHRK
jgi:hypothetical protein